MVMIALPHRLPLHDNAENLQILQIGVKGLPVRRDLVRPEGFLYLGQRDKMVLIRLLQHNLGQTVELEFLIGTFWHDLPLFSHNAIP